MNKFITQCAPALLAALLTMVPNPCSADITGKVLNSVSFATTTSTIQHLDHGHYKNTQATSDWTSNKNFITYSISPELIWNSPDTYAKVKGSYGWVLDGKKKSYPFHWDVEGDTKGFEVEMGKIWDVNGLFTFLPCIGFQYNEYDTKIKHQRFSHRNIGSFLRQNGNKSHTRLYFPYIGFEIDVKSKLFCYDVQYSLNYNFGYGGGHNRIHVHHTVITDLPSTSRYGSHTKYHDLVLHNFEFAIAYSPAKKWTLALEFDYTTYYNTRKLHVKLDHNRALVAAGQFTRSQYHRMSELVSHEYSIIFHIAYSLSGEGGAFITH